MFTIYTKSDCLWCVKAKELMKNLGANFVELKLDIDYVKENLRKIVPEHLLLTVPQIFVYNTHIGGYDDLLEYAEKHNMMGLQQ